MNNTIEEQAKEYAKNNPPKLGIEALAYKDGYTDGYNSALSHPNLDIDALRGLLDEYGYYNSRDIDVGRHSEVRVDFILDKDAFIKACVAYLSSSKDKEEITELKYSNKTLKDDRDNYQHLWIEEEKNSQKLLKECFDLAPDFKMSLMGPLLILKQLIKNLASLFHKLINLPAFFFT